MLETLANVGEFVGALGVIVSIGYLAVQIRQNTRAVRSASYHQAAEQTWTALLSIATEPDLAELLIRSNRGEALDETAELRIRAYDGTVLYGFENMVRLHEEGLIDDLVFENVVDNSLFYLTLPRLRAALAARPGILSRRLEARVARRAQDVDLDPEGRTNGFRP
ncbi:MAG: hypothetical protein AAGC67_06230 [Myxococcota bacterium]